LTHGSLPGRRPPRGHRRRRPEAARPQPDGYAARLVL